MDLQDSLLLVGDSRSFLFTKASVVEWNAPEARGLLVFFLEGGNPSFIFVCHLLDPVLSSSTLSLASQPTISVLLLSDVPLQQRLIGSQSGFYIFAYFLYSVFIFY